MIPARRHGRFHEPDQPPRPCSDRRDHRGDRRRRIPLRTGAGRRGDRHREGRRHQGGVHGNAGKDLVYGGAGNDKIYGGAGDDELWGQTGNDKIWGQSGDDVVSLGAGDDAAQGLTGNDTLIGGAGHDVLIGESFNIDTLRPVGNAKAKDKIYGNAGIDLALALKGAKVSGAEARDLETWIKLLERAGAGSASVASVSAFH